MTKTLPTTEITSQTSFASKHFLIGIITPLTTKRNAPITLKVCEALCELGFIISLLAVGDEKSQNQCFDLSEKYPDQIEILESSPKNTAHIFSKVNVMLFPIAPTEDELKKCLTKGIVPIMPNGSSPKFENYDPQNESGNAFLYPKDNFYALFATIVRAFENYKFSYDWKNLQKQLKKTAENF